MAAARGPAAAIVTIRRAQRMTSKSRRMVGAWLRRQADDVERRGHTYANRNTARLSRAGSET